LCLHGLLPPHTSLYLRSVTNADSKKEKKAKKLRMIAKIS
jgi:hypothetical protein